MKHVYNLGSLLESLESRTSGEEVTVSDLLDAVGRRAYGPLLLLLGFISITPVTLIPGVNWLLALLVMLIALQIVVGKAYPWVPSRLLRIRFSRSAMLKGVEQATPYACQVDRFLKPRLVFLTEPPFVQLVGMVCLTAALVTFPLGLVPLGPVLPSITVLLFGLALTARDGFLLILSGLVLVGAIWLAVRVASQFFGWA